MYNPNQDQAFLINPDMPVNLKIAIKRAHLLKTIETCDYNLTDARVLAVSRELDGYLMDRVREKSN